MVTRHTMSLVAASLLALLTGCATQKTPDGLPDLVPCKVTITQSGAPVENVEVYLKNKNKEEGWATAGRTDESGTAEMYSLGKYKGIPKGEYIVVLQKTVPDDPDAYKAAIEAIRAGQKPLRDHFKLYSVFDTKYNTEETSDLEVTVEKRTKESFDLGAPVQIEVGKITREDL
ncbi:MAG: hypothetical protein Q4G68_02600 [Planctomycetia bacterium]|nr:hypothetical protein [Planctomycetia bacterium]